MVLVAASSAVKTVLRASRARLIHLAHHAILEHRVAAERVLMRRMVEGGKHVGGARGQPHIVVEWEILASVHVKHVPERGGRKTRYVATNQPMMAKEAKRQNLRAERLNIIMMQGAGAYPAPPDSSVATFLANAQSFPSAIPRRLAPRASTLMRGIANNAMRARPRKQAPPRKTNAFLSVPKTTSFHKSLAVAINAHGQKPRPKALILNQTAERRHVWPGNILTKMLIGPPSAEYAKKGKHQSQVPSGLRGVFPSAPRVNTCSRASVFVAAMTNAASG